MIRQPVLLRILLAAVLMTGTGCSSLSLGKRIREPIKADYAIQDTEFRDSIGNLVGSPLVDGNNITELLNGDEIFGSMVKAIQGAKTSITMEMYIWSSGKASDPFVDAIVERARAGVKVRLLIDAVGSARLKGEDIKRMTDAGAVLARYNPPIFLRFFKVNHRTHRKLLVVDGRIGFIGGVCISDPWMGNAQPPNWRDTHFRIEGPAVGAMQAIFADNWQQTKSEVLHGKDYFPYIKPDGSMLAQCFKSGPSEGAETARLTYLLSFAAANKSIRISHAYFVPDELVLDALVAATERGVKVEIIFPRKIDNIAVRKATWSRFKKLLESGALFYEYQPTLYHCKVVIVDDIWSMVGSVNFDDRSMRINDEANMNVLDRAFAQKLIETFEDDKSKSKPLTKETFAKRKPWTRFADWFGGLFAPQL